MKLRSLRLRLFWTSLFATSLSACLQIILILNCHVVEARGGKGGGIANPFNKRKPSASPETTPSLPHSSKVPKRTTANGTAGGSGGSSSMTLDQSKKWNDALKNGTPAQRQAAIREMQASKSGSSSHSSATSSTNAGSSKSPGSSGSPGALNKNDMIFEHVTSRAKPMGQGPGPNWDDLGPPPPRPVKVK